MTDGKKLLILGASGYVGKHLFNKIGADRAIATYYRTPLENGVYFDIMSMDLSIVIDELKDVSHAIILLGDTKPDSCARYFRKSQALNVDRIKSILEHLRRWKIKPIFTSTEVVFDGTKGNYIETDETNPLLLYGRQKVEIERYLQDSKEDYLIIRLALTFGSQRNDGTLFINWLDSIEQGKPIFCAHDQICSPIYIDDVIEALIRLIDLDCSGIFHLSGWQALSKIRLNEILIEQMNEYLPTTVDVISRSINDFKVLEKRPLNVSMSPNKLVQATGLKIRSIETICKEITRTRFQMVSGIHNHKEFLNK